MYTLSIWMLNNITETDNDQLKLKKISTKKSET